MRIFKKKKKRNFVHDDVSFRPPYDSRREGRRPGRADGGRGRLSELGPGDEAGLTASTASCSCCAQQSRQHE